MKLEIRKYSMPTVTTEFRAVCPICKKGYLISMGNPEDELERFVARCSNKDCRKFFRLDNNHHFPYRVEDESSKEKDFEFKPATNGIEVQDVLVEELNDEIQKQLTERFNFERTI